MFRRDKQRTVKRDDGYSKDVNEYIDSKGIRILKKLYDNYCCDYGLSEQQIIEVFGKDFPKSSWIKHNNITSQLVCLLEQIGYGFASIEDGKVYLDRKGMYKSIVENHLRYSGRDILYSLADCCERTHGRVSYNEMNCVIGIHYPKAIKNRAATERICIIIFLKQTGMLFKFDETHVYFP